MKYFTAACALAATVASEQIFQAMVVTDADVDSRVPLQTSVFKNEHGSLVEQNIYEDITESKITLPQANRASDYSR